MRPAAVRLVERPSGRSWAAGVGVAGCGRSAPAYSRETESGFLAACMHKQEVIVCHIVGGAVSMSKGLQGKPTIPPFPEAHCNTSSGDAVPLRRPGGIQ